MMDRLDRWPDPLVLASLADQPKHGRRPYRLTAAGANALAVQSERMNQVALVARERLRTHFGGAVA